MHAFSCDCLHCKVLRRGGSRAGGTWEPEGAWEELLGEDGGVLGPLGTPIQLEPPDKDLVTPDANVLRWRKVMYP